MKVQSCCQASCHQQILLGLCPLHYYLAFAPYAPISQSLSQFEWMLAFSSLRSLPFVLLFPCLSIMQLDHTWKVENYPSITFEKSLLLLKVNCIYKNYTLLT